MSADIKQFTSAKSKAGDLEFRIDDEVFHRRLVTIESADSVAGLTGNLGKAASEYSATELMAMVKPFIEPDDWDRFDGYVRKWVEPSTFAAICSWLTGAVSGAMDPTQPASSPGPSASTGTPSPDGVSATASPIP